MSDKLPLKYQIKGHEHSRKTVLMKELFAGALIELVINKQSEFVEKVLRDTEMSAQEIAEHFVVYDDPLYPGVRQFVMDGVPAFYSEIVIEDHVIKSRVVDGCHPILWKGRNGLSSDAGMGVDERVEGDDGE